MLLRHSIDVNFFYLCVFCSNDIKFWIESEKRSRRKRNRFYEILEVVFFWVVAGRFDLRCDLAFLGVLLFSSDCFLKDLPVLVRIDNLKVVPKL